MSLSFFLLISFLAILLQCAFIFFNFFSVSHHIPGPTFCVSHYPRFSFFSPFPTSYTGHFSFSRFFIGFTIFQVKQCLCTIFDVFQFSRHIPGPTVYISPFSRFSVSIFQVIQYLCLIFHVFKFSGHISGPAVCISHFSRFSLFLPIFKVLQCVYLIFHDFQCF